ncbi:MAG: ABC transporter substrate-binding protein [Microbacteriaceae bacterium]|jgi:peptide/nickel transport system substrate-binding protein|nr:ABC transporter substrate-binding protein [Microbacteriaceae bacterium]
MKKARIGTLAAVTVVGIAVALTGCANSGAASSSSKSLTIGTTDKITTIDPAGSYDNGSYAVETQVYPFLMNTKPGSSKAVPDIATSAKFTSAKTYTVKLKKGLTFANGHKLTSSDVKFSFDRVLKINNANGPASLLSNLDRTTTNGPLTVVFHLKSANDQTFPQVLTSPAGPIVDEQSFSATKLTPDATIVKKDAFAGQYKITSYKINSLVSYAPFDGYKGVAGKAANEGVNVKYYADASNLRLDVQKGNIDVAYRSLLPTDIESLSKDKNLNVVKGPGGEIRYIVFNFNTQPYGAKTAEADSAKALAVRQAAADLIDRNALATQVYKGTYTPLYSFVPDGLTGATTVLKSMYGDGKGGPSLDKAKQTLEAAGVTTPVTLKLQYNNDHYGAASSDEYALIKSQLENGGLFKVDLQSTEYTQYSKDRVNDVYPAYQLGWFPDYSDADNYLTPFFTANSFLKNHADSSEVQKLIQQEATEPNATKRTQLIEQAQEAEAKVLSTLPFLQGAQVLVANKDVKVPANTLDASFKFRYGMISKK